MSSSIKYLLLMVGVCIALFITFYSVKSCNIALQEVTDGVPGCGRVVEDIEEHIPAIIGGHKPSKPKPSSPDAPGSDPSVPEDPRPSKFWLNPRIDVGIGMGTTLKPSRIDMVPKVGVGVSVFSHGKGKMDTKYRLLRIGVQTNLKEVEVTASPVMVRLGSEKHPLLSNTYVYPYVGYNVQRKSPTAGIGLSVSF